MAKTAKTAEELADLVMAELKKSDGCEDVHRVQITGSGDAFKANVWNEDPNADETVQRALLKILPSLQEKYTLAP